MSTYMITDAHDNQIADGIQTLAKAREIAQTIASRTGHTLWIHDEDGDAHGGVPPSGTALGNNGTEIP